MKATTKANAALVPSLAGLAFDSWFWSVGCMVFNGVRTSTARTLLPLRPLFHPALDQPAFAAGSLFVALKVLVISLSRFPAVADAGPYGIVVLISAKKRNDLQVAEAFVEQIDFRVGHALDLTVIGVMVKL